MIAAVTTRLTWRQRQNVDCSMANDKKQTPSGPGPKHGDLTVKDAVSGAFKDQDFFASVIDGVFDQISGAGPDGLGNDQINAIVTPTQAHARQQADASAARIKDGKARLLEGVPVAVKDNFCTKGITTTAASKILHNFVPTYDSFVTEKLSDAGAVMVGKANMDEFGMGSTTTNSIFGPTVNPEGVRRGHEKLVAGGSSGGSAAAVAANYCLAALGTDTGGSIRQPASFCGVVGMKPTYGLCSRWGIVAYASSMDQAGVITKTVPDAALMLGAIVGHDANDSTSIAYDGPAFGSTFSQSLKGTTIGIPKEFRAYANSDDLDALWGVAEAQLTKLGATVKQVSLPNLQYALPAYYVIALCEASSNLARYDGVRYGYRAEGAGNIIDLYERSRSEGFGNEVIRRILMGTFCLSSGYYDQYFAKAAKVRAMVAKDFAAAFEEVDALCWPTTPTSAFEQDRPAPDPVSIYLEDIFTVPVNLSGLPAINVPAIRCAKQLPMGLTFAGPHFSDELMLRIAHWFEESICFE